MPNTCVYHVGSLCDNMSTNCVRLSTESTPSPIAPCHSWINTLTFMHYAHILYAGLYTAFFTKLPLINSLFSPSSTTPIIITTNLKKGA